MTSLYPDIFFESLGDGLLLPYFRGLTWQAMQAFGAYDMRLPTLVAAVGETAGCALNALLGMWLCHVRHSFFAVLREDDYQLWSRRFQRYGVWLLVFPASLTAGVLTTAAGFFRADWRLFLALVLASRLAYYALH